MYSAPSHLHRSWNAANGYSNELDYLSRQVKLVGLQQECATYLPIYGLNLTKYQH